ALPTATPQLLLPKQTLRARTRKRLRWLAAAAAVGAVALGVWMTRLSTERFNTPVGELREIQLADGSIVNLNAQSEVVVQFTRSERDIRLARGEAMFKVARDPARPFRVRTTNAIVEAVGTQFNVNARPDGTTTVAVLEGKVKLAGDNAQAALAAGEVAKV